MRNPPRQRLRLTSLGLPECARMANEPSTTPRILAIPAELVTPANFRVLEPEPMSATNAPDTGVDPTCTVMSTVCVDALWVTVKVWPAIVIVPVRVDPVLLAET